MHVHPLNIPPLRAAFFDLRLLRCLKPKTDAIALSFRFSIDKSQPNAGMALDMMGVLQGGGAISQRQALHGVAKAFCGAQEAGMTALPRG
jgi:hypothetical protein